MEQEYFGVSLEKLLTSGGQTLYMVAWSLIIGTIIGIILALILVLCRKGGLVENLILYNIVSIYINIVRSAVDKGNCWNDHRKYSITCPACYLYQSISCTLDGK